VAERSAFPIRDRKPAIATEKWAQIAKLARRERTAIEWLQPYQRRGSRLVKELRVSLSDIAIINNFDKHRRLHVTRSVPQGVQVPHVAPEFGFKQNPAFGVPLESGTCIDIWTFVKPPPPEQMNMKISFRSAVEIKPGVDRLEEPAHLCGSIVAVMQIIQRFRHLFSPSAIAVDITDLRVTEERP
jgi:hypothetical protein